VSSTNMSPTPFLSKSTKEDTTIADLAGVPDAEQIKTDSVCHGVRMVKYNQRLQIRKNSERASYPGMKAFATRR
jgi:enolase